MERVPASNALPEESTLPDDPDTLKGMIRGLLAMLRNRDLELSGVRQWLDQLLLGRYGPQGEHLRPDQPPSTTPSGASSCKLLCRLGMSNTVLAHSAGQQSRISYFEQVEIARRNTECSVYSVRANDSVTV